MKKRSGKNPRGPSAGSLASGRGFEAFVVDQLGETGDVTSRKMFGGVGLYCDGVFFGIIARDVLYLKVDDRTLPAFEAAGSKPFTPYPGRSGSMQYYAVPVGVIESAPELARWARASILVAGSAVAPPGAEVAKKRRNS